MLDVIARPGGHVAQLRLTLTYEDGRLEEATGGAP